MDADHRGQTQTDYVESGGLEWSQQMVCHAQTWAGLSATDNLPLPNVLHLKFTNDVWLFNYQNSLRFILLLLETPSGKHSLFVF